MSSGESSSVINANTAQYCYLDFDLDDGRSQLARAAAFVHATNSRYHFSSPDLLLLGGSEISRIPELAAMDHEWSSRAADLLVRPPLAGNRIVVQLDWSTAPLACENFATLCFHGSSSTISDKGEKKKPIPMGECGKPLTYKNCVVHRVIPQFILQGGDFVFGNGSGGESIYGKKFKDERAGLLKKHDRRGILSMGNSGKNSNTSQFFITFAAAPQCDGKHVVFGQVISGWEVIDAIESMGRASGDPTGSITVTDCGLWMPSQTPPSGFWYDTPDPDSFTGMSSMFIVRPRVAVIGPNPTVLDKFYQALRYKCSSVQLLPVAGTDAEAQSSTDIVIAVQNLLRSFSIDVVLVAPACRDIRSKIALPWADDLLSQLDAGKVVMECKPMDAVDTLYHQSWLQLKREIWNFDYGNM